MKYRIFLTLLLVLLSTMACEKSKYPMSVQNVSVDASNIDNIIFSATQSVRQYLPDAEYAGLVYKTNCDDLPHISGEIAIVFVQEKKHSLLLANQILTATVVVDVNANLFSFTINDETTHYISANRYPVANDEQLRSIIKTAHNKILETGSLLPNCQVTITQLNSVWSVEWYQENNGGEWSEFCIDNGTLEVTNCP